MIEKTCSQFIKEMKAAGFEFTYKATDGVQTFTGEVKADGKTITVKITSSSESRKKIKEMYEIKKRQ